MEVQRTTTQGKSVITDSLKLTYNIYVKGDKKEITGELRKDDEIVGRFNASDNGIVGFSLHDGNGLTSDEIKQSFSLFVDDISSELK